MEIERIVKYQRMFDRKHGWDWSSAKDEKWLKHLQYSAIALCGEIGEFSNLVKKVLREFESRKRMPTEYEKEKMKEELVDIFIYTIKILSQLFKANVGKEYFRKMKMNESKFKDYEVG